MSDSHEEIREFAANKSSAIKSSHIVALLADRDRLAAALKASPVAPASEGEDAARYRWLRTMWCQTILEDLLDQVPGHHPQTELDAAIDAAGAASLGKKTR